MGHEYVNIDPPVEASTVNLRKSEMDMNKARFIRRVWSHRMQCIVAFDVTKIRRMKRA
jgi:hypothetical protein